MIASRGRSRKKDQFLTWSLLQPAPYPDGTNLRGLHACVPWPRPPNSSVLTKHLKGIGTGFDQGKRQKADSGERRRITSLLGARWRQSKMMAGNPVENPSNEGFKRERGIY